jgi:pimeloyl-ACP methyl ester carboxylesterase
MPVAHLSSVNLYYETHGSAFSPPIVLLHGACETFQISWSKQTPVFAERYHVIGVDLRGHGQSDNPAGLLETRALAADVYELLGHLGYSQAHVCGFSGGASTALFFATQYAHALRSLILVSNNMEKDQTRVKNGFWSAERQRREEPVWWQTMQKIHRIDPAIILGWWEAEDARRPNFLPEMLAHITAPALVMGGDRDPLIPLDQTMKLYRALPNAQLAILPGVGHGAPRRAQLFNTLVLDFLGRVRE